MRWTIVLTMLAVSACASDPPPKPKLVREWSWINDELYQQYADGKISPQEVNHAFAVAKNSCLIESLKIPVPSPSCTQAPIRDCSGLGSGLRGFCEGSQTPGPDCDYSSVDESHSNQNRVYESCLEIAGWRKTYEPFQPVKKQEKPSSPDMTCFDIGKLAREVAKLRESGVSKAEIDAHYKKETNEDPSYADTLKITSNISRDSLKKPSSI